MSFEGMVGDKKMQVGALWHGLSMDISFSEIPGKIKLHVEVNETTNYYTLK